MISTPEPILRQDGHSSPESDEQTAVERISPVQGKSLRSLMPELFAAPTHQGDLGMLGRYRVWKELGRGGMGAVYLGFDSGLDRKVALKMILPELGIDNDSRERFLREARAAARVKSDHVVTIFDVGEDRGIPFLAMEYLQGCSLADYLKKKGPLSVDQAIRIGRETALGLQTAHDLGLVHRDIKPANLWLESPKGRVKILDFGLAREQKDERFLTGSGIAVGTPAYMSPEQARNDALDGRSDLFSLGVVLYQLLTGQLPFRGDTSMAILTALAVDEPTPIRTLSPTVSEPVARAVTRLLRKRPQERFGSATEFVAALDHLITSPATKSPAPLVIRVEPLRVDLPTENVWSEIDADSEPLGTAHPISNLRSKRLEVKRFASRWYLALGLLGLVVMAGVFLLSKSTPPGTLVIESDEETAELTIKQDGQTVQERTRQRRLSLPPGTYSVELAEKRDGFRLSESTIRIVGEQTVTVRLKVEKPKDIGKPKETPKPIESERAIAEWVFSLGGRVNLQPDVNRILLPGSILPTGTISIHRVELVNHPKVTDEVCKRLQHCKSLASLRLDTVPIGDQTLSYFSEAPLISLDVRNTGIGDTGLLSVKDKRWLYLYLDQTKVTDRSIMAQNHPEQLLVLTLGETAITDRSTEWIAQATQLDSLILTNTPITDLGFARLSSCRRLQFLNVSGTKITDLSLPHLAQMTNLKICDLTNTTITDAGIEELSKMVWLNEIRMHQSRITQAGVKRLGERLPACRIYWNGSHIEPTLVEPDRELAKLVLSLRGEVGIVGRPERAKRISDLPLNRFEVCTVNMMTKESLPPELFRLARLCPRLNTLHTPFCSLPPEGMSELSGHPTLGDIWLSHSSIGDREIQGFKNCSKLWQINLCGTGITDQGLSNFKDCTGLTQIHLCGTKVTGSGLVHFRNCPNISNLNLYRVPLNEKALPELIALKGLKSVSFNESGLSQAQIDEFIKARPDVNLLSR